MTDENNISAEIAKELTKDIYEDAGHEIVKPAGKLVGLVPRAIRAALQPIEKWILQREYNVAETEKLLAMKLEKIDPEKISPPEAYVAIPALKAISYCMDSEELRNMYANLLANSMTDVVKKGVHPGFVEIIKQLCPDEAKILRQVMKVKTIPTVGMRCENDEGSGVDAIRRFSDIAELTGCENPENIEQYFDNLLRLGLIESSGEGVSLTYKEKYSACKNHPFIVAMQEKIAREIEEYPHIRVTEGFVSITDFGRAFCLICIDG